MSRALRLVFLGHVARFSGAEIETLRFIEAADGLESTVLLAEDGPLVEALVSAGARVEVMPLPERARGLKRTELRPGARQARAAIDIARYIGRLRTRLRQLDPDVIGAISLKAGTYGVVAARLAGIPLVWHLHDQINSSYISRTAVRPMRLLIATLPSAVIAPSHTTLETVGRLRPGIHTAVIPPPIPIPPKAVEIRPNVQRIGIVGRLAPWKGQHIFLEAFARSLPEPEIRAVVIGSAIFGEEDYARQLEQLADRLGIGDRVDFTGFRRDVQSEFEKLDVLVHASVLTEPFGNVVFEAMAAGLPVVAARSGGVAQYIDHGRNGLLHEPNNAKELGAMLRLVVDDNDLRVRLATGGRERVNEFAPPVIVERLLAVYRDLADIPPRFSGPGQSANGSHDATRLASS
jgi:glycosyltransferase involved in cell wall biosynthesis